MSLLLGSAGLMKPLASGAYAAVAVDLTANSLSANPVTTAFPTNIKKGIVAFSFYVPTTWTVYDDFINFRGASIGFRIYPASGERIVVTANDSAGSLMMTLTTGYSLFVADTWHHIAVTWDSTTGNEHLRMYKNGTEVSYGAQTAPSTDDILYSHTRSDINPFSSSQPFHMSDLYINFGEVLDLDTPAEMAKFYTAGKPVDLGSDGSTPTGNAPTRFFSGTASTWHVCKASGDTYAIAGSGGSPLSASASPTPGSPTD